MGWKIGHKPRLPNVKKIGHKIANADWKKFGHDVDRGLDRADKINDQAYKISKQIDPILQAGAMADPRLKSLVVANQGFQAGSQGFSSAYDTKENLQRTINRGKKGDTKGAIESGVATYKSGNSTIEKAKKSRSQMNNPVKTQSRSV